MLKQANEWIKEMPKATAFKYCYRIASHYINRNDKMVTISPADFYMFVKIEGY